MAISALPLSTTRLLGSTVVITNPVSLVKELIDNGVDAGATSIDVSISPNTVDKIQVRDNGRGIQVDDFDLLGRRAHTSKLRKFEELETKAGQSLGFRGEALASANSLAIVKVTTKTARDPVASLLLLKFSDGGVKKKNPVAAPVGTTVQALQLFENVPVRKHMALKESRKTLLSIKRLLETYAIALPRIRLSLKVSGDHQKSWSYSPSSSSANAREAATQIFGHSLVSQCVEVTASLSTGGTGTSLGTTWGTLSALLPRNDGQLREITGKRQFISVDSRPILSSRGTGKKIVTMFKKELALALDSGELLTSLSNPFMQLSIDCNPGSYDPNVSPLKDEVMFKDEQGLLDSFQALCARVYKPGGSSVSTKQSQSGSKPHDGISGTDKQFAGSQLGMLDVNSQLGLGSKATPVDVNTFEDIDDFPIDLELLESFDDELEGIIGTSGNTSQGAVEFKIQPAPSCPQANAKVSSVTDSLQTISAMMRTRTTVNLARKQSDNSDEGSTLGLVPVQVVPRRESPTAPNETRSRPDDNDVAPLHRLEDIGLYFQPKKDQPIEIASDETATLGNAHGEEPNIPDPTKPRELGRRPLMELTDSMLNTLRNEDEEEEEPIQPGTTNFSSPEPDLLLPHNAIRGLVVPLTRRGPGVAGGELGLTSDERHWTGLLSSRTPPGSAVRTQRRAHAAFDTSPARDEFAALQTPPSSDTLPPARVSRPSTLIHRGASHTGIQRMSRGVGGLPENVFGDDELTQAVTSFGNGSSGESDERFMNEQPNRNLIFGKGSSTVSRLDELDLHLKSTAKRHEGLEHKRG
ncbi:hypothetical protein AK830_g10473 [Neonectria ditissima]|uniref:DNA mismatch repair protein S5 domain-containing protein n=1 Tax=Neonectria ditissima TaxID=78410 RepID=A0A0P7APZ0_9HYPO|nr:hypothetical protein AK830_g10473 [Neonectria ditissima]